MGIPEKPLASDPYTDFWKNTSDNCEWANDKAHKRRYEAVFEIHPNTYSIV